MKILKIIMGVCLLVLVGCDLTNNTKSTTSKLETTTSTTTLEDLSDAKLWEAAIADVESINNLTVKEDFDTNFVYNGKNNKSQIVSQMDIMSEQLMKLSVSYNLNNSSTSQTFYLQQENGNYYFYQLMNNKLIKNEMDYKLFEEEESSLIYDFTFEQSLANLTLEEEYTNNQMDYVKFSRVFKLNELPSKYQGMFDENIKLLLGQINPSKYLNLNIKETIILNKTNRTFDEITYDLSSVTKGAFQYSALSSATNISSIYTIQFENRGLVNVNIENMESASLDDAPNNAAQTFLTFPQNSGIDPVIGKADYADDVDLIMFHIEESSKYIFKTTQAVDLYVLSEYGHELYSGNSSIITYLQPGKYYLMVYSQNEGVNYKVSITSNQDDYADVIQDTEHVGIIDGNVTKEGVLDYSGDIDLFKLTASDTDFKYYTVTLYTNKYLKVTLLLNGYSYEYTPKDGKIVFGYGLHQKENVYIQIQSNQVVNYRIEANLYTDENDAPERIDDPNIQTIAIDEPIQEATHTRTFIDEDFFRFVVVDEGYYEFYISLLLGNTSNFYGDVELYDINGTLLTNKFAHKLTPGDYFLKVKESGGTLYELTIKPIIDDYSTPTTITLTETNHIIEGSINYIDDTDEFDVLINEEGYYYITYSNWNLDNFKLIMKDEYDNVVQESSIYSDNKYYLYLYPGRFSFHITGRYTMGGRDYSIVMSKTSTVTSDIGYDYKLNESYLGQLILGQEQQINFEYPYDVDVYKLTITEPQDFATYGVLINKLLDVDGNEIQFNPQERFLSLNTGTYYIYFYSNSTKISSFKMTPIIDDYAYSQTYSLPLDTTINGIIQYTLDVDQFEITITEPGLYEYIFDSSKLKMEIYDESGNLINLQVIWNYNVIQLINQTYTIKILNQTGNPFNDPIPFSIHLKLQSTELDSDPDVAYLPKDMYRALTVGEVISAKFDSDHDIDVYIIEVTEGAYYNFHYEPRIWPVKIIHENGTKYVYSDRNYLHVGINYILVANDNMIDYKLSISK